MLRRISFAVLLLLAAGCVYASDKGDTIRIADTQTKLVVSRKHSERSAKKFLTIRLVDNRLIEIKDCQKRKRNSDVGTIFRYENGAYVQCGHFKTDFEHWKKARKGRLVHVFRAGLKTRYELL